jgi:hypothetical protein
VNYAEQLEHEAYHLARKRLIHTLSGTPNEDRLDGYLARLDSIHATNMELAADWTPPATIPGRMVPPYRPEHISGDFVAAKASSIVAEATTEEQTNARD